jgi:flagellar basal-body rod protein FlgB
MTIAISSNGADGFASGQLNNFEVTPEGNGVTLEDEMMKVTSNQMDYQAATTLYTRSIALIRTALGRTA